MRGDKYEGWAELAGDFPPSVNTDSDPTDLKPFESPSCYGVDCQSTGYLKTGAILEGTPRTAHTRTIGGKVYGWYYDRLWRIDDAVGFTANLIFGAKYYDDVYAVQGFGKVTAKKALITFMPALSNDMWLVSSSGSHILPNATSGEGQFRVGQFFQEAYISTATHATTVSGQPHFANADGVYAWNGQTLKELTRAVRTSLGSFVGAPLTVDYSEQFLIGENAYVIDLESGKLYDYGTSGFRFTTRTLASADYTPFQMDGISLDVAYASEGNDLLRWQTKVEDGNWYDEEPITMQGSAGTRSHIQVPIGNGSHNGRKFTMRITALPSFLKVRSIKVMVREFTQETPSE